MIGARAVTSLSLTVGAAVLTLAVAAGILVGPAILDCSHQQGGFGACLRAKAQQSGLLSPAENPGGIAANATEYEPPRANAAILSGPPGSISASADVPSTPTNAQVAMADPPGTIAVGTAPAVAPAPAGTDLLPPAGTLHGAAAPPRSSVDAVHLAELSPPAGALAARGKERILPNAGDATLLPTSPPPTVLAISAGVPFAGRVPLVAELTPVSVPLADPPADPPPLLVPYPKPAPPRQTASTGPVPMPKTVIKYDPRFPNVLVLPPPNTGEKSSFATLQLR